LRISRSTHSAPLRQRTRCGARSSIGVPLRAASAPCMADQSSGAPGTRCVVALPDASEPRRS
jgi:hypothetical protein